MNITIGGKRTQRQRANGRGRRRRTKRVKPTMTAAQVRKLLAGKTHKTPALKRQVDASIQQRREKS